MALMDNNELTNVTPCQGAGCPAVAVLIKDGLRLCHRCSELEIPRPGDPEHDPRLRPDNQGGES